jgi:hypothetical protein
MRVEGYEYPRKSNETGFSIMPRKREYGKVVHGVHSFIKRGKLRDDIPGVDTIKRRIREESSALLKRYGDSDPAFLILCKNQIYIDGIIELAAAEIWRHGVLNKTALGRGEVRVRDIVRNLSAFINSSRLNVLAMEKLRKEGGGDEPFDVIQYAKERYGGDGSEESDE